MPLLCAPSKVPVVGYRKGHCLFNFSHRPPGIGPSHAGAGAGLALRLALAPGTLADKTVETEEVPTQRGLLARCPWCQDIDT